MERTSLATYFLVALVGMCSCKLHQTSLSFKENGVELEEKMYFDENNRFEFIKVPAHNGRVAVTVMLDTTLHYAVHKMPAMNMCYVINSARDEDQPLTEEKSVKAVKNRFPDEYTIRNHKILVEGDADLTTKIGKIAAKFCSGDYQIKNAVEFRGDEDVSVYVNKKIQAQARGNKRSKRDVQIRDFVFMGCSQVDTDNTLSELNNCNGVINNMKATCRFRTSSCTYRVHCNYDQNQGAHVCRGSHDLNSIICCTYRCEA